MFGMFKDSMKLPIHVKLWMFCMVAVFTAHLPFLSNPLVLISVVAFFATLAIIAPITYMLTQNINALALTHFVLWPVALANGIVEIWAGTINFQTLEGQVLMAGYGIFAISLILDYRIIVKELSRTN